MAISPMAAARRICELGNWQVTNLELQKILYIAHMVHMGRTSGARLVDASFEAWDYGPVEPGLYRQLRMFGSKPIRDIFFSTPPLAPSPERDVLDETSRHLIGRRVGELVAMTHWEGGAWARNYLPGVKGIAIPDRDILDEYRASVGPAG